MIALSIGDDLMADIHFDAPHEKVNILGEAAMTRLDEVLDQLARDAAAGSVRGVIFTSGKKGVFLAGADVNAFVGVAQAGDAAAAAAKAREGQAIFSKIASLSVPTVAAINGACLGGGLELALACTSRVAGDDGSVKLGLPEVRLGLVPGWGGTQRLPRLIGVSRAFELILTGKTLPARRALSIGLVDAVVPVEGVDHAARQQIDRLASGRRPRRPRWRLMDRSRPGRALVIRMARRKVARETRGRYPAPLAAVDAVAYGLNRPIQEGLAYEAGRLGELIVGPVSRNLVGLFLAGRAASSTRALPAGVQGTGIARLGVLGAGTMGGGIAALAAMAGLSVRLRDVDAAALAKGMAQVHRRCVEAVRRGRLSAAEARRREDLVAATIDPSGFTRCDLVIEAVVEDLSVKQRVLAEIEPLLGPRAIMATNTSSLSVTALAQAVRRPGRVLGLHFFNPVHKMPLLEVVRGPETEEDAVAAALKLARRLGKTPVIVKDTPGFIVNRILMPYLAGAMDLLAQGIDQTTIDKRMVGFGMPMGPFALLDRIGIDVAAKVAAVLASAYAPEGSSEDVRLLRSMAEAGLLGQKAGKGFYRYGASGAASGPSPEVAALLSSRRGAARPDRQGRSAADVVDTLVDAMITEAARLLDEEAVDRPEVIDLAMVLGAGFPPFRGGVLRYADTIDRGQLLHRLQARGVTPLPLSLQEERFYR